MLGSYYGRGMGVTKDPAEAVKWYRKAAEQGQALAQYAMGGFYANGRGVPKNVNEAIKWWRRAGEQNQVEAQAALGQIYFTPQEGTTNCLNFQEAFHWLRKAAEQGHAGAMNNLGLMYEQSFGLPKADIQEAAKWYRAAAEKGDARAQANLGLLYLDGRGVRYDLAQAYLWLKLSANQGNAVGTKYVDELELPKKMSESELAEGERLLNEFRVRLSTNAAAGRK